MNIGLKNLGNCACRADAETPAMPLLMSSRACGSALHALVETSFAFVQLLTLWLTQAALSVICLKVYG